MYMAPSLVCNRNLQHTNPVHLHTGLTRDMAEAKD